MPSKSRKQVLVNVGLVPKIQNLVDLSDNSTFNTIANKLLEKGLAANSADLTPQSVVEVLPGFSEEDLQRLALVILEVLFSRKSKQGSVEGDQAIKYWRKILSGEPLGVPEKSRLAEAVGLPYDEVDDAISKIKEATSASRS